MNFKCTYSEVFINVNYETAGTRFLFVVFQNFCSHFIPLKEDKPTLLLEVLTEYSSHQEEKSGKFSTNDVKYFSILIKNKVRQEVCNSGNPDMDDETPRPRMLFAVFQNPCYNFFKGENINIIL